MLKSCSYCGRIHDGKIICKQKEAAQERRWKLRKNTNAQKFRSSTAWTKKSIEIKKRDRYMCVCCMANLKGTVQQYNTEDLSVHHIIPLCEDYNGRLNNDNLITVCGMHHEMCEAGLISREEQKELIDNSKS